MPVPGGVPYPFLDPSGITFGASPVAIKKVKLRHVFTAADSSTRTLPVERVSYVDTFQSSAQAPGGFIDASGRLTETELESYPNIFTYGTTWRVEDVNDGNRTIWAGALTDLQQSKGVITLKGEGWGRKADKLFKRFFWQTRDEAQLTLGDSDPFDYDQDPQIEMHIRGKAVLIKVTKKAVFKKKAGVPSRWASSVVFWAFDSDGITRVAGEIEHLDGPDAEYYLEICKGTGPSGSLTVQETISLGASGSFDVPITGSHDLVVFRACRDDETKNARGFRTKLKKIRINGLAVGDKYPTYKMVRDVCNEIGGDVTGIQVNTTNGLPMDIEDSPGGEVLDELAIFDDRIWLALDDGDGIAWKYRKWGDEGNRVWVLTRPQFPVNLIPVERFNEAIVPFRYPGGMKSFLRVRAEGAVAPFNAIRIELDDPLPPERIARAFGKNIIEYLAEPRFAGEAIFTEVEDKNAPGVPVAGTRVRPGDKIELQNYGGVTLRVAEVYLSDSKVRVRFADSHPLLERLLARRRRVLNRGRGQARATLGGLGLRKPKTPTDIILDFRRRKTKNHGKQWDGVVDWAAVTEDIKGTPTGIKRYIAQLRACDENGDPIDDGDGDKIHTKIVDAKSDDDGDVDPYIPTRARFNDLEHPKKWGWQPRVRAVDVLGKESVISGWGPVGYPEDNDVPPSPLFVGADGGPSRVAISWDTPTDPDDSELPHQDVAFAQVQGSQTANAATRWDPGNIWKKDRFITSERRAFTTTLVGTPHYLRVRFVDGAGNKSAWVEAAGSVTPT